ncbi:MAG TPA: CheR family methyltransferase, partial [Polyangiaceae bacterium]
MSQESITPGTFPIVGVGASAGGLAPTMDLIRELGAAPGVAVVVVHHLDPTHPSGLVEILSRVTPLPVVAAADGVPVELDHVYVIQPNTGLLIHRGILEVVPRVDEGGLHLPINRFFESLALDQHGLAVGVVLSGTGFDGSQGIKILKREGGITMAQDTTAEHGSMPTSAIATGCVDFILPPGGISGEIVRLGAHALLLRGGPPSAKSERDFQKILHAMRRSSGVDFSSYRPTTIRRRLDRRLFFHGLTDLGEYLELLKREPAEIDSLCEEALIHVTGFFRDPEVFEALRAQVFPKICEGRTADAPIRVWVPGCSTGEEVYSLVICLLEFLEETQAELPIKIFGTDLSPAIIEKARAGTYPESLADEISPARLQRFFVKEDTGYRVRRDIRDLCVFAKQDVAQDPPFSSMDLVSCRNLMIYLGVELQDRVIGLLHYALRAPGFLLLGSAESVRAFVGFSPVDGKHKIYQRTSAAPRLAFDFASRKPPVDVDEPLLARERSNGPADVQREVDRLVLAKFAPPGVVVTADLAVVQFRGRTGPYLEHAPGTASFDLLRTAREELRLPLRRTIEAARAAQGVAREPGVSLVVGDQRRTVALEVIPFLVQGRQSHFLVLFEDVTPADAVLGGAAVPEPPAESSEAVLRQELASTRQYLESVIQQMEAANEELKAANEEIVSSNEELRSANEELQSAKQELQATNEELRTVNDEMRERTLEATRLSDDLTNVLSSVEIPILITGRDLHLRRFTPAARRVFGLVPTSLGRLLSDIPGVASLAPSAMPIVGEVLVDLRPVSSRVQHGGHWYELTARPYVTTDGRIDGAVLAARDIDAETQIREYQDRLRRMAFDATLTEERERRRIAIDLHDRIGQTLALAQIKLTGVRDELVGDPGATVAGA